MGLSWIGLALIRGPVGDWDPDQFNDLLIRQRNLLCILSVGKSTLKTITPSDFSSTVAGATGASRGAQHRDPSAEGLAFDLSQNGLRLLSSEASARLSY